ncbi:MAG TPA: pyridoxamine 5'-phosphate oxidase [Candidatus Krumholzibacteria bacterium]|nr:pyridoxamine 5'-phosphate oxidase [Candidatus Krumholzibacteria bacterium]
MTLRDLVERFNAEMDRAMTAGVYEPTAASLATMAGRPSVRMVLLKEADERGFVVYTNLESRKGRELVVNPWAALCFWWAPSATQIRVEGRVEVVSDADADEYFAQRPRAKQISAWASHQSSQLGSRQELLDRVARLEDEYRDRSVPRPPYWTGIRVIPDRIEFWYGHEDRLHERFEYRLERGVWIERILSP